MVVTTSYILRLLYKYQWRYVCIYSNICTTLQFQRKQHHQEFANNFNESGNSGTLQSIGNVSVDIVSAEGQAERAVKLDCEVRYMQQCIYDT